MSSASAFPMGAGKQHFPLELHPFYDSFVAGDYSTTPADELGPAAISPPGRVHLNRRIRASYQPNLASPHSLGTYISTNPMGNGDLLSL